MLRIIHGSRLLDSSMLEVAPSCVVGSGLEPVGPSQDVPLEPLGIRKPFLLYLGRIDPNKGCETNSCCARRVTLQL